MLKRSKFCVHRGLPNSEASGDPGVSLDDVCTSSAPSAPVPCDGSWDTPCIIIPVQSEKEKAGRLTGLLWLGGKMIEIQDRNKMYGIDEKFWTFFLNMLRSNNL